jgi:beta-galactosidase GanA
MDWHAVAHGADAIVYWQWRSALGGQEQLHGTLVDQSGRRDPFYDELNNWQGFREFALLAGSEIKVVWLCSTITIVCGHSMAAAPP